MLTSVHITDTTVLLMLSVETKLVRSNASVYQALQGPLVKVRKKSEEINDLFIIEMLHELIRRYVV